MNDRLVWIDCEMTGLSLEQDALIEVAALVTDYELNILGEGVDVIIKPPAAALDQMNELVTKMHADSGLLTQLESGVTLREAEERVLTYVREFVPEPGKAARVLRGDAGDVLKTARSRGRCFARHAGLLFRQRKGRALTGRQP